VGGLDDWALGNGVLCAVVSDPSHEAVLSERGGVLVDLGHCGRHDDQWNVLHPLFNLSRRGVPPIGSVESEVAQGEARIRTRGEKDGLEVETTYALDATLPRLLRIRSRIRRIAPGPRLFAVGDLVLHGHRSLAPFVLSIHDLSKSVGFAHPASDPDSVSSLVAAIHEGDLHVLVGSNDGFPGIAYGLRSGAASVEREDGSERGLPWLALNGEDFTLQGLFTRRLWAGDPRALGWFELAQTVLMDLAPGEVLFAERAIYVADQADVAGVTDLVFADGTEVVGMLDATDAVVHVAQADGAPVTMARAGQDGRFHFRVPPGRYQISVAAAGGSRVDRPLDVGRERVMLPAIATGAAATVLLPRSGTMRLVFVGQGDTPTPRFHSDLLDFHVGGRGFDQSTASNAVSLAGESERVGRVRLAPGRYRVLATRGPEYGVEETTLAVRGGEAVALDIAPPSRVLETPGWIAADLHVHAAPSFDSQLPLADRVRAFAAQGGELIVATEHDQVADYRPTIRALGLEGELASMVGVEVTGSSSTGAAPFTIGHANVFPLAPSPLEYRGGAPRSEGVRLREVAAWVHAQPGGPLLQLNHPRGHRDGLALDRYMTHLAVPGEPFRPDRPVDAEPNRVLLAPDPSSGLRDVDFDVVEIMNGSSLTAYRRARADWLSLLLQGFVRTATANSDSHDASTPVALPRTYVRVSNDRAPAFDREDFVQSIRAGHAIGSTGPFLEVSLGGAGPGALTRGRDLELRAEVRAAAWVPVSELRVIVDGHVAQVLPIRAGETREIRLHFERDAVVIVEVQGEPGDVYAAVAPGFTPLAFTNPIFVDADGDGRWQEPGLGDPVSPLLRDPDHSP
jgi:hypothetical protein